MTTTKDITMYIDITSREIYADSAFTCDTARLTEDTACNIELILMYANDCYYPEYVC